MSGKAREKEVEATPYIVFLVRKRRETNVAAKLTLPFSL